MSHIGLRGLNIGLRALTIGLRALTIGLRALTIGLRALTIGLRALTIGLRTATIGLRAPTIGLRTATIGLRAGRRLQMPPSDMRGQREARPRSHAPWDALPGGGLRLRNPEVSVSGCVDLEPISPLSARPPTLLLLGANLLNR